MIICVVGKTRSAKSKVAEWLGEAINFPVIEVSGIVKRIAGSKVRKDLQLEKQKHQTDHNWLYREIQKEIKPNCIISGIREMYLLDKLRADYGCTERGIIIIAVLANDFVRKQRAIELDNKTEKEFEEDELREKVLYDIDKIIGISQLFIDTSISTIQETKEKIAFLAKLFSF